MRSRSGSASAPSAAPVSTPNNREPGARPIAGNTTRKPEMNQKELISAIMSETSMSKVSVTRALEGLESVAKKELAEGNEVTLPGIGKLLVHSRPARSGRNPATGAVIQIAAKNVVQFRPSASLSAAV